MKWRWLISSLAAVNFYPGDFFFLSKYIRTLYLCVNRQQCWPWQSRFVPIFLLSLSIPQKQTQGLFISFFSARQLNLKLPEHQRRWLKVRWGCRWQYFHPLCFLFFPLLYLNLSQTSSHFLSHFLSNRCSIFTRTSSRGIRWRTGAKWSDRSTYPSCLRSPWPLILLEVEIYM